MITTTRNLAVAINAAHAKCQSGIRQTLTAAIECGELLEQAKASIPHGEWLPWIRDNCQMSTRTAQGYMRLAGRKVELASNAQPVALLGVREALEAIAEPTHPVKRLVAATDALSTYGQHVKPRLAELENAIDAPGNGIKEFAAIAKEAGEIQNRMAELKIRAMRAAGEVLTVTDTYLPPDGKRLVLLMQNVTSGGFEAEIASSDHPGFYHIAMYVKDDFGGMTCEGTKKPIRWDYVPQMLRDEFKAAGVEQVLVDDEPWTFNRRLYSTQREYVDSAILGKGAA